MLLNCGAGENSWVVPWTKRRSNHSILKEINPEYSLEELMLKLQYFGHLMQRTDSLEKTPMLGKIEGKRRRGRQRMRCLDGITSSKDMNLSKFQVTVKDRGAWRAADPEIAKSQTGLNNWTTTKRPGCFALPYLFLSMGTTIKALAQSLPPLPCNRPWGFLMCCPPPPPPLVWCALTSWDLYKKSSWDLHKKSSV